MASIDNLTDSEIRIKLTDLGYPVIPVTETTRKVLLKKLKYLLEQSNLGLGLVGHATNEVISPTRPSLLRYRPSVSMNSRNRPILHPKRGVPGSATSNTFGSFNKPETSYGVTSTVFDTSGGSLFAANSQPTTTGLLGASILPFGQPQTTTSTVFDTSGGSLFAANSQPSTTGLLGATTLPFGQPQTTTSTVFDTSGGSLFAANSQPSTTGLLGATTLPFGQPQTTTSTVFDTSGGSLFAANSQPSTTGLLGATTLPFGQPQTTTSTVFDTSGGSLFAANSQPSTTGLLGATTLPFGQPQTTTSLGFSTTVDAAANTGSGTVSDKYVVVMGTDVIMSNGVPWTVRTRHHCITCMKEYESKSLEELRFEDYCRNPVIRTGPRQGVQSTEQPFEFGAGESSATTRTSLLKSTKNKPIFDQTSTSNAVQRSLFGATTSQPTDTQCVDTPTSVCSTPATKDVFSIEVLKHSIERLEEIVRCAVCLEAVKPTIVQCANGHLICSGCKRTLNKCPSCRASFSDNQPSRLINQIIEALPSCCIWPNCKQYFKSGDDHELFCEYRLTRCMWDDCQWSGCRSEIYRHISTVHKLFGDKTSTTINLKTFPMDYFDPNIIYSYSTVYLLDHGHIIWKKTVNYPGKKIFSERFYLLPKGKPQKDIYVEVLFTSKGPKFVCKIKLNPKEDALEENTIHVPWHMLPNFLDHERRLTYNICITEE